MPKSMQRYEIIFNYARKKAVLAQKSDYFSYFASSGCMTTTLRPMRRT